MAFDPTAFRQAAIKSGYKQSEIDEFLKKKQTEELVRSGSIPFNEEFAAKNPDIATKLIGEGMKVGQVDPKNIELKGASASDVNLLKGVVGASQEAIKNYNPKQTGLLDSIIGSAKIAVNAPGSRKNVAFRSNIADIRTSIRNYISGAAIPKSEAKEFLDLIPKTTDSDSRAQEKLEQLQKMAFRKIENTLGTAGYNKTTGEEYTGKEFMPVGDSQVEESQNPLSAILGLDKTWNLAKETPKTVGSGVVKTGQNIIDLLKGNTESIKQRSEEFRPEVDKYNKAGMEAYGELAPQIATSLFLGPLLNKGKQALGGLKNKSVSGIKNLFEDKVIPPKYSEKILEQGTKLVEKSSKARKTIIKKAVKTNSKVEGNKVYNTVVKWAKDAKSGTNTAGAKQIDDLVKRANKYYKGIQLKADTAKRRWDIADKGFRDSGKTGDSIMSGYHRAIRNGLRETIDKAAPGFKETTEQISQGLKKEKILGSVRQSIQKKIINEGLQPTTLEPSAMKKFIRKIPERAGGIALGGLLYRLLFGGGNDVEG